MKNYLLYLFSLFSISIAFAQEENLSLSLQEAIDYAIENNRTSKNAALDIEAAKKQKWETTAIGLPQISAKVDYQNWIKQQVSLFPAAAFDPFNQIRDLQDYYNVTPNPANTIPDAPEGFVPVVFGTKQSVTATATLSQLLFDGSYLVGLQSAKVFLEISKNAKEKTDLEVRKATINAYGNVLLSEESVQIYEDNIAVLQKNLDETQKIFENGLTEEENVEQLQITLKQLESGYKNALRLKGIAYKMLNITLGTSLDTNVTLKEDLESLAESHIDLGLLNANDDVQNTIDYKIAANDKRSKELLLKLEKSKALPSLSAFVNGGYNGNNDEFNFFDKDQEWFGSSLFGVSLNIPIFSSLQRTAATQRAKINLEKATNDLTEVEEKLRFQVASVKSNYQFSIEQYQTSKENLTLAERIEKKNQTKFFEGITTSFDLRQAQQQLYSSQQEYLQAMLDVITNKVELETVLNQTN